MRNYQELVARKADEHGGRFDASDMDKRFIRYYESGERIKIETCGMVLTGTVGVTTGWRPAFILMRTARSTGSPWLLGRRDTILAVKCGRHYRAVEGGAK